MSAQQEETLLELSLIDGLERVTKPNEPPRYSFDVEKYFEQAKDFDLTEEQKIELLTILWDIMMRFVELGFAIDSVSLLEDKTLEDSGVEEIIVVEE